MVAALIALVAALAGYTMVKFFGVIFLGQPREEKLAQAHDAGRYERTGMVWLVLGCIALGLLRSPADTLEGLTDAFSAICRAFAQSRPTARNLFWAIERMKKLYGSLKGRPIAEIRARMREEALEIRLDDIAINEAMGRYGAPLVPDGKSVLTHCNAGALATAGYGTALGVIRAAVASGKKIDVFADETRPFLQGARLTAWELQQDGIPVTLITDPYCVWASEVADEAFVVQTDFNQFWDATSAMSSLICQLINAVFAELGPEVEARMSRISALHSEFIGQAEGAPRLPR